MKVKALSEGRKCDQVSPNDLKYFSSLAPLKDRPISSWNLNSVTVPKLWYSNLQVLKILCGQKLDFNFFVYLLITSPPKSITSWVKNGRAP